MNCCATCFGGNNGWGICKNTSCWCHLEQRIIDEKSRLSYKDPTGETAIGNIHRQRRKQQR